MIVLISNKQMRVTVCHRVTIMTFLAGNVKEFSEGKVIVIYACYCSCFGTSKAIQKHGEGVGVYHFSITAS